MSALPYAMYPEPPGYQILDVTIPPGTVRTFDITPPYQVLRFALCAMAQDIHVTVRSATLVSDQDYCEAQNLTDLPCELDNELPVPLNELQITQSERTRNSPLFNWGTRYRVTTLGGSARIFIAGRLGEFPSLQVTQ